MRDTKEPKPAAQEPVPAPVSDVAGLTGPAMQPGVGVGVATGGVALGGDAQAPAPASHAAFLQQLKQVVTAAANRELAGTGRTAEGCPYITFWLDFYSRVSPQHLERAVHRYAQPAGNSPAAWLTAIEAKAAAAVAKWRTTGAIDAVPDALTLPFDQLAAEPSLLLASLGAGAPLDSASRARGEASLGASLSGVRVHADAHAAALARGAKANAFTVGAHVVFADGEYRPGTPRGDALLAHELAHTVQQTGSAPVIQTKQAAVSTAPLEREADSAAVAFLAHEGAHVAPPRLSRAGGLALQRCGAEPGVDQETAEAAAKVPTHAEAPTTPDVTYGDVAALVKPDDLKFEKGWMRVTLDGDGDQVNELRLSVRDKKSAKAGSSVPYVESVEVELALLSDLAHPQAHTFDISSTTFRPLNVLINVEQRTDGFSPTRVRLGTSSSVGELTLKLYPPVPGKKERDYRAEVVTGPGEGLTLSHTFSFAEEKARIYQVFRAGTPRFAGGVHTVQLEVGAFGDSFVLTAEQPGGAGNKVVLGLLPTTDGGDVRQGARVELAAQKALTLGVLAAKGPALELDLDGDGVADVTLFVREQGEYDYSSSFATYDPAKRRSLLFSAVAAGAPSNFGYFEVKEGKMELGGTTAQVPELQVAAASAAAKTIGEAKVQGADFAQMLSMLERSRAAARERAVKSGRISTELHQAFTELSDAMLAVQVASGAAAMGVTVPGYGLPSAELTNAAAKARVFDARFTDDTKGETKKNKYYEDRVPYEVTTNPYTGYQSGFGWGDSARTAQKLIAALDLKFLSNAMELFNAVSSKLDLWVLDRLASGSDEDKKLAETLRAQGALHGALAKIADKNPTRVYAAFTPQEAFTQTGVPITTEVLLFYWKEGSTWHLYDVTRPTQIFDINHPAGAEKEPPRAAFEKLNYEKHFSEGYVHYELPSGTGGVVRCEKNTTWKDYLTWAALGLGAAALIAATAGAGSVVVTSLVVASAVAGTASSVVSLMEMHEHGYSDAGDITMEVVNIVGSLAGAGALVIRELSVAASVAKNAGTLSKSARLTTALKGWSAANKGIIFPLAATSLAADTINLGVMVGDTWKAYQAIDKGTGSAGDKLRAKLLLLGKASALGAVGVLAVRGGFKDLAALRSLRLEGLPSGLMLVGEAGSIPKSAYEAELKGALKGTGIDAEVKVVSREELSALTKSESSLAVTKVEGEAKTIYVLDGAHPRVLREEAIHLQQLADKRLAGAVKTLTEGLAKDWKALGGPERLKVLKAQLELERDAQKRLIDLYAKNPGPDVAAALAVEEAFQNLDALRAKAVEVRALEAKGGKVDAAHPLLETSPQLTTKTPFQGSAIDDTWKTLDEVAFVDAYKKRYPNTTLTDQELKTRFSVGKRLNPETWHLKDPTHKARPKAEVEATFKGADAKEPVKDLWQADKTKVEALLKERDAAYARKQAAGATEEQLSKAHYEMNEASRKLGEYVGEAYVKSKFPGAKRIYGGEGSRSGDFDLVFELVDSSKKPPVTSYIVVEAKGGSADLGVKMVGGKAVEQGTKPYFDAIVANMKKVGATSKNAAMLDAATKLEAAAKAAVSDPGRLKYLLVKTPIKGPPSSVQDVVAKEFNLGP